MEKAKVYFTDFRTAAYGDGLPAKLKKLMRRAGVGTIDMEGKFVAIKCISASLATSAICARIMRRPLRIW